MSTDQEPIGDELKRLLTALEACNPAEDGMECLEASIAAANKVTSCPIHLTLLTMEGCSHCENAEEELRTYIERGVVKTLAIESPEGLMLAIDAEIDAVPFLLVEDCRGGYVMDILGDGQADPEEREDDDAPER